jgi:RibD C-terminal domain
MNYEALCDLPHECERRRAHSRQPVAARGEPHGGAVRASARSARRRLLADRSCDRQRIRQGPVLPRSHRPDLSPGTLVRPARCRRLRDRARCAGQDRLGTLRHRRRSDRRGADRTGLRRASGGAAPGWRLLHLRRRGGARSRVGAGDPQRELGIERLLLEGGGGSNGAFLRAGLIDEISLAICPAIDGSKGAPSIFDSSDKDAGVAAPIRSMSLASTEVLEGGVVWLRYRLQTG